MGRVAGLTLLTHAFRHLPDSSVKNRGTIQVPANIDFSSYDRYPFGLPSSVYGRKGMHGHV